MDGESGRDLAGFGNVAQVVARIRLVGGRDCHRGGAFGDEIEDAPEAKEDDKLGDLATESEASLEDGQVDGEGGDGQEEVEEVPVVAP